MRFIFHFISKETCTFLESPLCPLMQVSFDAIFLTGAPTSGDFKSCPLKIFRSNFLLAAAVNTQTYTHVSGFTVSLLKKANIFCQMKLIVTKYVRNNFFLVIHSR